MYNYVIERKNSKQVFFPPFFTKAPREEMIDSRGAYKLLIILRNYIQHSTRRGVVCFVYCDARDSVHIRN